MRMLPSVELPGTGGADGRKITRALITGVTGFIGAELARHLMGRGIAVAGLARAESRHLVPPGVEPILADLAQPASLSGVTRGASHVFHSAALIVEPQAADRSGEAHHQAVNVGGTLALAHDALASGVTRFIQVSTIGVYGDRPLATITEDTLAEPDSIYHRTKFAADQALLGLFREKGLPVVIARPPITVGPGNLKTHLLKMARLAAKNLFPTFGSSLAQRLPLVEVADLCTALELAAVKGADGEVYLISSGENYTFGQILSVMARFSGTTGGTLYCPGWLGDAAALVLEAAAELLPFSPPLTRHKLAAFRQDRGLDISKARKVLGFAPVHTGLPDLLARALSDYRARGLLPAAKSGA